MLGFSRGSYTIRSLCGLINNVGILKRPDAKLIVTAFKHYKRSGRKYHPDGAASVAFRKKYSHPKMKIKFVGVWDTVGAMGIPIRFLGFLSAKDEFYDTKIGPNVDIARHALGIDEFRSDFEPTIWEPRPELDIQQVWFAGAHSDVGGGYYAKGSVPLLSDTPLKWMMNEAGKAGLTLEKHLDQRLRESATAKLHLSRRSFFRLKRAFYRPLEHGKGATLIHKSVRQRWDKDRRYRPKNLVSFLEANDGWGTLVS